MNRRHFMGAAAASGLAGATPPASQKNAILELLRIQLRNGPQDQRQRTTEYLKTVLPSLGRAGIGPIGLFTSTIAQESPFILCVLSFPSLSAIDTAMQKLADDKDYQKAQDDFNSPAEPGYVRIENSLLRGFNTFPNMVAPPADAKRPARLFELRTYESNNSKTLKTKIKMFDDAEIAIFKRCGLLPIFFGETIVGRNMPSLTYMVAYDDWAGREKAWKTFLADPDWKKLRSQPEYSDAAIVSNISNSLLTPLPFSPVR
jgi:hypothetical protein